MFGGLIDMLHDGDCLHDLIDEIKVPQNIDWNINCQCVYIVVDVIYKVLLGFEILLSS